MQIGLKIPYNNVQVGLNPAGEDTAEWGVLKNMLALLPKDRDLIPFFPTY